MSVTCNRDFRTFSVNYGLSGGGKTWVIQPPTLLHTPGAGAARVLPQGSEEIERHVAIPNIAAVNILHHSEIIRIAPHKFLNN